MRSAVARVSNENRSKSNELELEPELFGIGFRATPNQLVKKTIGWDIGTLVVDGFSRIPGVSPQVQVLKGNLKLGLQVAALRADLLNRCHVLQIHSHESSGVLEHLPRARMVVKGLRHFEGRVQDVASLVDYLDS